MVIPFATVANASHAAEPAKTWRMPTTSSFPRRREFTSAVIPAQAGIH
jgi:hypothetical protein